MLIISSIIVSYIISHTPLREQQKEFMQLRGCALAEMVKSTEYAPMTEIIVMHGALESNWAQAGWVDKKRQIFAYLDRDVVLGKKKAKKHWHEYLQQFDSFEASYKNQIEYYRRRHYSHHSTETFLKDYTRTKYAVDPNHVSKIREWSKLYKALHQQYCK